VDAVEALRPLRDVWRSAPLTRNDTEHEAALVRLVCLVPIAALAVLFGDRLSGGNPLMVILSTILAVAFAGALLAHVLRNPLPSPRRRYLSIVCDQLYLCLLLFFLGPVGPWVLPATLLVAVGAGLRYGSSYSLVASVVGVIGVTAIHLIRGDDWSRAALYHGWIGAVILVPAYVAMLGKRLEAVSHNYRARARKMQKAALFDQLTGLANRANFRRILERAVESARAGSESDGFAILYCDLDGFKGVNDTHGHHVGDLLLKNVAAAISACVRGSDVVARLGGDEFAIFLKGIRDAEIAKRIGGNIVSRVKSIDRIDGRPIHVSCSVGITMIQAPIDETEDLDRMLARADEAMYQAKRAGKNQFYLQWAS
jgi:diguanylate cyclase (GGDEF)-like protein